MKLENNQLIHHVKQTVIIVMSKYKRPLLLTGAGFATIWGAPSTSDITSYIRTATVFNTITGQPVGDWFYHKLCNVYHQDQGSVNFELIMNYVENLHSYFDSKYRVGKSQWKNAIYAFLKEDPSLYEILEFDRIYSREKKRYIARDPDFFGDFEDYNEFFRVVYQYFVQQIYKTIHSYTQKTNLNGDIDINIWLKEFIDDLSTAGSFKIYSTNYDRNIPQIVTGKFHEGFSGSRKDIEGYSPNDVLRGQPFCHYNLHGSTYYKNDFRKGLIITDENQLNFGGYSSRRDQESRVMLNEEIITGLNKASGILRSPFSEFYHRFYQDCLESDLIVIAGYSFGDMHINNALRSAGILNLSQQLRIIDYHAINGEPLLESTENDWVDHVKRFGRNFIGSQHPFYKILTTENDLNFKIFRKGMAAFLERKEWKSNEF